MRSILPMRSVSRVSFDVDLILVQVCSMPAAFLHTFATEAINCVMPVALFHQFCGPCNQSAWQQVAVQYHCFWGSSFGMESPKNSGRVHQLYISCTTAWSSYRTLHTPHRTRLWYGSVRWSTRSKHNTRDTASRTSGQFTFGRTRQVVSNHRLADGKEV